jgi:hypothetical protein
MHRIHQLFAAVSLCVASLGVSATPIRYGLEFRVQYVDSQMDSRLQVGNSYLGSLIVDDGLLLADGINKVGVVSAFRIQMEDVIWDLNLATPLNEFLGFRGPEGLGSTSPGFDVLGGSVTNLRGGVFGSSDFPFVDFSTNSHSAFSRSANACGANPTYCGNAANYFSTNNQLGIFGGSMLVYDVPQPATVLLFLTGFLGVLAYRSRRQLFTRTAQ